jgi:hypothetical protein
MANKQTRLPDAENVDFSAGVEVPQSLALFASEESMSHDTLSLIKRNNALLVPPPLLMIGHWCNDTIITIKRLDGWCNR